jgi:hypothetical protein
MHSLDAFRVPLKSFPGTWLTLPEGSQLLTPQPKAASTPLPRFQLLLNIQARLQQERAKVAGITGETTCRVLLLLPDKTRQQHAAQLAVDALLGLCQHEQGWSLEIVFGLGTHPLMQALDIKQMLGSTRLRQLENLGSRLQQQSTLTPLPLRALTVAAPQRLEGPGGKSSPKQISLRVPEILWQCDMILVAGDTDLHPYEGRGGSGGIHKMIAVGIGCLSAIRISHSMEILNHPKTRAGESENQFVETVDNFARAIINAIMHPSGSLRCKPLGISTIAQETGEIDAFWIGNNEEERAILLDKLKLDRTIEVKSPINFVVADTEPQKGTDLLAGARSLHFLCNYDNDSHPLLSQLPACRTAIMYNACHQLDNANGIGNTGTVLHLKALMQFAIEALHAKTPELYGGLKLTILNRWERYLSLVSQEDKVFARVEQLLIDNEKGRALTADVLESIDQAIPNSFGSHRYVLDSARIKLLNTGPNAARQFLREALERLGFKGLGEGGQRALRLLTILRKFDQLLVATQNTTVLKFLNSKQPRPRRDSQLSDQKKEPDQQIMPLELVGLSGIALLECSPQQALMQAIKRHKQLQKHLKIDLSGEQREELKIAFLQQPVILRRSDVQSESESSKA